MTDPNVPPQPQAAPPVGPGAEVPPLVGLDDQGKLVVDFAGAIEHIPDTVLLTTERQLALEQVRKRVCQILCEGAAGDLADEILAITSPEPDNVETAGGESVEMPPPAT